MTGPGFEQEVRSVARALWNLPTGDGSADRINNDEIDCVCHTEDVVHIIECTTDRKMDKFRTQVTKLTNAKSYLERNGATVKPWIVTKEEPTPDQRSHARGLGITTHSLQEFKRRLLDSRQYLEARWVYRFGSANDPEDNSYQLDDEEHIDQPLTDLTSGASYSINRICSLLNDKKAIVLVGPFGAGKSLTVREVFKSLRQRYYRNSAERTPVAINLRDHWGQTTVDEVLRRHANRIGFSEPNQLVRAWNAGEMLPLLDGIDELASPVIPMGRDAIRRSREEALKVIQAFMRDLRGRTGVLLAGRDHYFDSIDEARKLMGLPDDTIFVDVGEFSELQATNYLQKKGINANLPTWLPRKPLLLGYLASRGLLDQVTSLPGDSGPALAWDEFLSRICQREAELSSQIDSQAVRELLEALATRARALPQGSGPLYDSDLSEAYKNITGNEPLEGARTLLQRLPGLTARDQEVGARSFVDDDMMEALRAGAVVRFIVNPYVSPGVKSVQHPLKIFGCSVAGHLAGSKGVASAQFGVAAKQAIDRWAEPTLALDSMLAGASYPDSDPINMDGLTIDQGFADEIDMEEHSIQNLVLNNCLIDRVRFDSSASGIKFNNCQIVRIEGIADSRALPSIFAGCDIQEFDNRHTNNAIIGSELPNSIKILLVIVRKLFLQRGSGRVESALRRGIDDPLRPYVSPVLELLVSEGIVYSHPTGRHIIWHGNRTHRTRMLRILEVPMNSGDPLMKAVSNITSP